MRSSHATRHHTLVQHLPLIVLLVGASVWMLQVQPAWAQEPRLETNAGDDDFDWGPARQGWAVELRSTAGASRAPTPGAPAGGVGSVAVRAEGSTALQTPLGSGLPDEWFAVHGSVWGQAQGQWDGPSPDMGWSMEQEGWVHLLWLHAGERLSYHRRVELGARFRPSQEGLAVAGYEVAFNPFARSESGEQPDGFIGVSFRYDQLYDMRRGGMPSFDWDASIDAMEWVWDTADRAGRLGFFQLALQHAGRPARRACHEGTCVEEGEGVFGVVFDLLDLDGASLWASGWSWGTHLGVDLLGPTGPYVNTSTTTTDPEVANSITTVFGGPTSAWPRAGVYAAWQRERPECVIRRGRDVVECGLADAAFRLSVDAMQRLVAGGEAVEAGVIARLESNLRWTDTWDTSLLLEHTWPLRTVHSDGRVEADGPESMVNLEFESRWQLDPHWSATASAWAERSDRREPTRTSTPLQWSMGASLGLGYRL